MKPSFTQVSPRYLPRTYGVPIEIGTSLAPDAGADASSRALPVPMFSARTFVVLAALVDSGTCFNIGSIAASRWRASDTQATMPTTPCPSTLPGDPSLIMSVNSIRRAGTRAVA